jgi:hypothetical protein
MRGRQGEVLEKQTTITIGLPDHSKKLFVLILGCGIPLDPIRP